jgi:hypothetical protein
MTAPVNAMHIFSAFVFQERYLESLPLLLFGGISVVSGLFSLSFPETLNSKLPDTVREAENIGNKALRTSQQ